MNEQAMAQQFEFTGKLYMNLRRSATAYSEYLQGGKTYLFARILKIYNEKIRELLLEKGYLLPASLQQDALALIAHYDIWLQKWNDLEKRLSPAADDEFIFANEFTFPREAAKNLEQEYLRAKQHIPDAE